MRYFGLAYLLETYCQVLADKKYQQSDWRIRPLPEEMQKYAREDTHYLLYIYDRIRIDLLQEGSKRNALNPKALIRATLHNSVGLAMKAYQKPTVKGFYNYYGIVENNRHTHTRNQLRVLKMLLKWRDYVARLDDESPDYMLPKHILFQIARDLPTTRNEMRDCRRASAEPPAIQKYQEQLMWLISQKLSRDPKKEESKNSHLNIDFTKQKMPAKNTLLSTANMIKTVPACATVHKLDR